MTTPEAWRSRKQRVDVLDAAMAYVDTGPSGSGDHPTVVLLHGNPTSSFLWRDVVAELEPTARCVAPDLIGMGDSDRAPAGAYRFADHARYVEAFLDAAVDGPVVLVVHDWGSALGFDWARRHPDRVRGVAYTEAIVRPVEWSEWPEAAVGIFRGMRSEKGEDLVLRRNVFVEAILPSSVLAPLAPEVHDEYRRPFLEQGEGRRPMLTWPREIPLDGEPADVVEVVAAYAQWLSSHDVAKLFLDAKPGSILVGAQREFCSTWPNQTRVPVRGSHFVPEDAGAEIGRHVLDWLATLPRG